MSSTEKSAIEISGGGHGATKAGQIWLRAERPRRQRLSRDRIIEAAIELLDQESIDALTMRNLAEHLGVGTTTLYGHVSTKDDVLDLALDAIYAHITPSDGKTEDWRAELTTVMHQWRSALLRHPWSAHLLGRPHLGPHMLTRQDALLATLNRAGLTGENLSDADYALSNYLIGSVLMQVAWQELEPSSQLAATTHIQANAETYPHLANQRQNFDADWDRSFTNGLTYLINGLRDNHSA